MKHKAQTVLVSITLLPQTQHNALNLVYAEHINIVCFPAVVSSKTSDEREPLWACLLGQQDNGS